MQEDYVAPISQLITREECEKKEKCVNDKVDNLLKVSQFIWIVGILITIAMAVFSYSFYRIGLVEDKISDYQITMTEIKTQLSQIQTDILWIKTTLKK